MLREVISGGQTGADRAALDAARAAGLRIRGWCPLGRQAEDGVIAPIYPLLEAPTRGGAQRTAWNVRDSQATLILFLGPESPSRAGPDGESGFWRAESRGTALAERSARMLDRPLLALDIRSATALSRARAWIRDEDLESLNVAGPRESEQPGLYEAAHAFLLRLFRVRVPRDDDQ